MGQRRPTASRRTATWAQAGEYVGAGFQFAATILLCLFGGRWLDGRLGTAPWLLLIGVFLGAAAGFLNLYRDLTRPGGPASRRGR